MSLLNAISYVKRGKNRQKVFLAVDKPIMPSEIAETVFRGKGNTNLTLVSRALRELSDECLVKVANPKARTGRLYQKTRLGKAVAAKLR
ncbi:MAG: ArsR family transcriptional regulator [archaeon]